MILINGERKRFIEIADRGFQYGDGLFETIEISHAHPLFLDNHLERLQLGCQRLRIPSPGLELLASEANEICKGVDRAVLKIIVTRGSGGRGYRPPELMLPTRVLSLYPYPEYPTEHHQHGIKVRICEIRLGLNASLAGIKHLNRLEQVLARAEWHESEIQEGVMLDADGYVIEGTMSNIFYIKNGTFYTPSLLTSGVSGIMRGIIMGLLSTRKLPVVEHKVMLHELLSADEVFVCNSIIGVWPVIQIAETKLHTGPNTQQVQCWLEQAKSENLNGV